MLKETMSYSTIQTRKRANDQAYNLVAALAYNAVMRGDSERYQFWSYCRHESAMVYCRMCEDYKRHILAGKTR